MKLFVKEKLFSMHNRYYIYNEDEELTLKWAKLIKVKEEVAKKLEVARANKEIGLSQEAQVTLFAEGDELEFLTGKEALLKEILMVSGVKVCENIRNEDAEVAIGVKVERAEGEKCERCWMYSTTVGEDKENPTICHKCSEALK